MNKVVYTTIISLIVLSACAVARYGELGESPTAEGVLQRMEEASNKIQDASLTVKYFDASGNLTRTQVKEFKKPNVNRTETTYLTPGIERTSLTVSDGEKIWSYNPDEQVGTVSEVKRRGVTLPNVDALHSFSKAEILDEYEVKFEGTRSLATSATELNGKPIYVLHLTPKPGKGAAPAYEPFNVETSLPYIGPGYVSSRNIAVYAVWRTPEPTDFVSGETTTVTSYTRLGVDVHTFTVLLSESHDGGRTTQKTVATNIKKFDGGITFPTEVVNYGVSGKVIEKRNYADIRFNRGIPDERFVFVPPTEAIVLDEETKSFNDETILQFEEKVKAEPDNPALRYALLRLYQGGQYPQNRKVLTHLQKLIELKPGVASLYSRLGNAYLGINKAEDALVAFNKALELKPDLKLGNSLARAYEKAGQTEKAIEQYKLLLETETPGVIGFDSTRVSVAGRLVQLYQNLDNLAELIEEYQTKLVENPDNIYLQRLMGDAYSALQDKENASAAYRKILALMSDGMSRYGEFDYNLRRKLKALGIYDEPAAFYEKMVETFPRRGYGTQRAYGELLAIYAKKKDLPKLTSTYERLIESKPMSAGQLPYEMRENISQDELVELIQKGLEQTPENVTLHRLLAAVYSGQYYEQRNLEKSASMYERAAELAPDDAPIQMAMAKLYVQRNAHDEARKAYQRAIELDPQQGYYRAHLAYVYNRLNEHEKAIEIGKAMTQERPDDIASHGVLATVYLNAEMYEEAISEYKKAIELAREEDAQPWMSFAPNTQFFRKCMARAYETTENYAEADAIYEKFGRSMYIHEFVRIYRARGDMEKLISHGLKVVKTTSARWHINEIINELSESGMLSELIAAFEKELQADPDNPEIYRALAQAYSHHRMRDPQKGIEMYKKVVELAPSDADAYSSLGSLYSGQGMHKEAIEAYEEVLQLQPERTYTYPQLAKAYMNAERKEDALKLTGVLKKRVGYNADAYIQLGDVYSACELPDKAIEAYEKAIELAPGQSWYLRKLAGAYEAAGKYEEADALYEKTKDRGILNERIRAYQQRGDQKKLVEFAKRIMKSDMDEGAKRSVQYELVRAFQQLGKLDEIVTLLQEELEKSPEDATPYNMLGAVYSRQNNRAEAIGMYEKVVELTPDDGNAHRELGRLYDRERMYDEAIEAYKKALELNPDESYIYLQLARAYANTAQTDEILTLADALKKRCRDGNSYSQLGEVYMAAQLYDEAVEAYKKAVKLSPQSHYKSQLANAYERAGKIEEAEAIYEKATDPDLLRRRMRMLRDRGDLDKLLEVAKKILKPSSQQWQQDQALRELVEGYSQAGRLDELISTFQEELKKKPKDANACKILGEVYKRQGDRSKAMEMYEKAAILAPADHEVQRNLGEMYSSQGMYQKSIAAYKKAIQLQPGYTSLYPRLAEVYARVDKTEEALKLADELKKHMLDRMYGGNQAYTQATLGDIYAAAKSYDEAIEAYKKAMELEPRNQRYFGEKLLRCYEQAGKTEEAEKLREEIQVPSRVSVSPRQPARKKAPSFSLKSLDGKTVKLSDFKGKVVILNFWATWAPTCIKEMAALDELYKAHKDDLMVIGMSVDTDGSDAVKAYIETRKITYPILIATREMLDDYEIAIMEPIETIPTTIILDKRGYIKSKHAGAQRKDALKKAYESATAPLSGQRPRQPAIKVAPRPVIVEKTQIAVKAAPKQEAKPNQEYSKGREFMREAGKLRGEARKAKFKEAIKIFASIIKNYPDTSTADIAQAQIGDCYTELEDWNKALKAYETLINKYAKKPPTSTDVINAVKYARVQYTKVFAYVESLKVRGKGK